MAGAQLFTAGDAADRAYSNIREASNEYLKRARTHCEQLWAVFEPYADPEFLVEIRSNFDARYWEMYLAAYLIEAGYKIRCPKPGPDVGIEVNNKKIWFEATSPTRGNPNAPDYVPELLQGQAQDVPEEKLILRYLNSISEKYERKRAVWLKKGVISEEDAFVIALNPHGLGFEHVDSDPPRILQAAFTVGPMYIVLDRETLAQVGGGYHFRDNIRKASGVGVDSGVFQREEYSGLSGLLCSRVDAANHPAALGTDFQLVPNPHAKVPLPKEFRLRGVYFNVSIVDSGYDVAPEEGEY